MSPLELADVRDAVEVEDTPFSYVPPLQRTAGQPVPIAAHGGLSYMAFERDGDAGTGRALEDALALIAEGDGQRVCRADRYRAAGAYRNAMGPKLPGVRRVQRPYPGAGAWGSGGRPRVAATLYDLRAADLLGCDIARDLRDPARAALAALLKQNEDDNLRRDLWFPQTMRDARRLAKHEEWDAAAICEGGSECQAKKRPPKGGRKF